MNPQKGEIWRHYKTKGDYEIQELGKLQVKNEALDMQDCVIYQALSDKKVWVRPLADFIEEISIENELKVTRFSRNT